ncbi:hypothetical protein CDD82_6138 [Ophiocordyceps australis]|uniref:RING-CH-type domain-containing protein n=1 Tax=Ophiocordyceps australis TaxID=1399860 RepID=A0A2C5YTS1_9HYPO|nr:hypothetical protein CDD82_6138 [Ophiocordyceps australis]
MPQPADHHGLEPPAPKNAAAHDGPPAPPPLRRCFMCLGDESPSDPPGTWVDPCPCTIEAHQECILTWVTDCERNKKPLKCPVCKATIELEGTRDAIVAASDALSTRFSRLTPCILVGGISMGAQFSLQMYGFLALWTFAGKKPAVRFLFGSDDMGNPIMGSSLAVIRHRVSTALVLMSVAPTLLLTRAWPINSHSLLIPSASVVGYCSRDLSNLQDALIARQFASFIAMGHKPHVMHWPPSPRLVMAAFPLVRSIYRSLWDQFVRPYDMKLNRQIQGLPPEGPTPRQSTIVGRDTVLYIVLWLLRVSMEFIDFGQPPGGDGHDGRDDDNDNDGAAMNAARLMELRAAIDAGQDQDGQPIVDGVVAHGEAQDAAEAPGQNEPQQGDELARQDDAVGDARHGILIPPNVVVDVEWPGQQAQEANADGENMDALRAPPVTFSIVDFLSKITNSIVGSLLLPGVSFAMGEALRLVLPRSWTTVAPRDFWGGLIGGGRPGLMQQRWGRSLVGGCLFIVLKDMATLYVKSRRVAQLKVRKVKNVQRQRRQ